jgi:hypothetical protein
VTARSRPEADINVSYNSLPSLKSVGENRFAEKASILPLQDGFWEPRQTAANWRFSFIEYCSYFLLILRHFVTCLGFFVRQNPDRMLRHTFVCYVIDVA